MNNQKSKCNQCQNRGFRHAKDCVYVVGKPNIDYVTCNICGERGLSLTIHLKRQHGISKEEYKGNICAQKSFQKRSIAHKGRENWVSRYKKTNPILFEETLLKMGRKVSETILSNEKEITRRKNALKTLWDTPGFREKLIANCSQTALKTSKNPVVLVARGKRLANWRKLNAEVFYEKCTSKLTSTWKSKGEKELYYFIKTTFPHLNFVNGSSVGSPEFTNKTKRRQVDIYDKINKIILEFDGMLHFKNIPKWNQLQEIQNRDLEFNNVLSKTHLLIRVSSDQWTAKRNFTDECKRLLIQTINNFLNAHEPKLLLIGNLYVKNKIS